MLALRWLEKMDLVASQCVLYWRFDDAGQVVYVFGAVQDALEYHLGLADDACFVLPYFNGAC